MHWFWFRTGCSTSLDAHCTIGSALARPLTPRICSSTCTLGYCTDPAHASFWLHSHAPPLSAFCTSHLFTPHLSRSHRITGFRFLTAAAHSFTVYADLVLNLVGFSWFSGGNFALHHVFCCCTPALSDLFLSFFARLCTAYSRTCLYMLHTSACTVHSGYVHSAHARFALGSAHTLHRSGSSWISCTHSFSLSLPLGSRMIAHVLVPPLFSSARHSHVLCSPRSGSSSRSGSLRTLTHWIIFLDRFARSSGSHADLFFARTTSHCEMEDAFCTRVPRFHFHIYTRSHLVLHVLHTASPPLLDGLISLCTLTGFMPRCTAHPVLVTSIARYIGRKSSVSLFIRPSHRRHTRSLLNLSPARYHCASAVPRSDTFSSPFSAIRHFSCDRCVWICTPFCIVSCISRSVHLTHCAPGFTAGCSFLDPAVLAHSRISRICGTAHSFARLSPHLTRLDLSRTHLCARLHRLHSHSAPLLDATSQFSPHGSLGSLHACFLHLCRIGSLAASRRFWISRIFALHHSLRFSPRSFCTPPRTALFLPLLHLGFCLFLPRILCVLAGLHSFPLPLFCTSLICTSLFQVTSSPRFHGLLLDFVHCHLSVLDLITGLPAARSFLHSFAVASFLDTATCTCSFFTARSRFHLTFACTVHSVHDFYSPPSVLSVARRFARSARLFICLSSRFCTLFTLHAYLLATPLLRRTSPLGFTSASHSPPGSRAKHNRFCAARSHRTSFSSAHGSASAHLSHLVFAQDLAIWFCAQVCAGS